MRKLRMIWVTIVTGLLIVGLAVVFAVVQNQEPVAIAPALTAVVQEQAPTSAVVTPTVNNEQTLLLATGQELFKEQRCTICHSVGGIGNKRLPLDGVGQRLTAEQIKIWIIAPPEANLDLSQRAFDAKQRYQALPAEQLEALVLYLQSQKESSD